MLIAPLTAVGLGSVGVSCEHRNNDRRGDQVQSNQGDLAGGRVCERRREGAGDRREAGGYLDETFELDFSTPDAQRRVAQVDAFALPAHSRAASRSVASMTQKPPICCPNSALSSSVRPMAILRSSRIIRPASAATLGSRSGPKTLRAITNRVVISPQDTRRIGGTSLSRGLD